MFKKLKDKLAEEVKSSPQRIQQFAQAAQAAVTSASSSISDITNNDLFSIGDNEQQNQSTVDKSIKVQPQSTSQKSTFQEVPLMQPPVSFDSSMNADYPNQDENQRQRRLSNSSFASDVSFRLPNYESPSMYHLQSDMEISASEAEERSFSSSSVTLDRVTKEQLYAAYKRTQERYSKYRTQYADLARHYKILERENAKARSVLVETQDKALRRISELREQCTLEQSAKAHLEKALRVDIEERNMKIDALNTKIHFLQNNADIQNSENKVCHQENTVDAPLINLSYDNDKNTSDNDSLSEITTLTNKIEKMEQLLTKYKESLKVSKEKNTQMTAELQILSSEVDNKNKEIEGYKEASLQLNEAKSRIQELTDINEELQNKINAYDFAKLKELSTLEIDLQKAQEEISQLQSKIEVFTKREEDYAISLAENKLSIHKELEDKENEIKSLKDSLSNSKKEMQSLNIVINDYKNTVSLFEEERFKLIKDSTELKNMINKAAELEIQIQDLTQKCQFMDNLKIKSDEEYKCLQLQLKQETAEKLAMIDRNGYLENRNSQLCDDITKKNLQISNLEGELAKLKVSVENSSTCQDQNNAKIVEEVEFWKTKYNNLETEIQEERDELVKLQSEIEKLLINHECVQNENLELHSLISNLKLQNSELNRKSIVDGKVKSTCEQLLARIKELQNCISITSEDIISLKALNNQLLSDFKENILKEIVIIKKKYEKLEHEYLLLQNNVDQLTNEHHKISKELESKCDQNIKLNLILDEAESKKRELEEELKNVYSEKDIAINKMNLLQIDKEQLLIQVDQVETECKNLKILLEDSTVRNDALLSLEHEKLNLIERNDSLQNEISLLKAEIDKYVIQIQNANDDSDTKSDSYQTLIDKANESALETAKENEILLKDMEHIEKENKMLTSELEKIRTENKEIKIIINELQQQKEDYNALKEEKLNFIESINIMNDEKTQLNVEIEQKRKETNEIMEQLKDLKSKNFILLEQMKNIEDDKDYIHKLEDNIKFLREENASVKSQSEAIAENVRELEKEISDVRKSHMEIEIEKEHLNSIIEELEYREQKLFDDKDSQTIKEPVEPSIITDESEIVCCKGDLEVTVPQFDVNYEQNSMKDENRRLQSDIAGLQSYLTKISKENSILNDKLRELLASSENDKSEFITHTSGDSSNEIQSMNERINDLIRENTLLIEENLELKDQLTSQNSVKAVTTKSAVHNNTENLNLTEKCNSLIDKKNKLEQQIIDLEDMNKSLSTNMLQMQENNEKSRLTNEKLERRLDEALVSLRHLHSLQENTELEYLRNILYEYLTGSGAHSVTLAKVLAAVVKFDDLQTQQVLQKEKERQGFLRQLGLI